MWEAGATNVKNTIDTINNNKGHKMEKFIAMLVKILITIVPLLIITLMLTNTLIMLCYNNSDILIIIVLSIEISH